MRIPFAILCGEHGAETMNRTVGRVTVSNWRAESAYGTRRVSSQVDAVNTSGPPAQTITVCSS